MRPGAARWFGQLAVQCTLAAATAATVAAHSPLVASITFDGNGATVVSLPGFGLLNRPSADAPFSYACSNLLTMPPSDYAAPLAFTADGHILVGTLAGLRVLDNRGCPTSDDALGNDPIQAVDEAAGIAFAVTGGDYPSLHKSTDGGLHWQRRAGFATQPVTALSISRDDPTKVYISQSSPDKLSTIYLWDDVAGTLSAFPQTDARSLLQPKQHDIPQFWTVGRDDQAIVNRVYAIGRATDLTGPFETLLHVTYFGGVAFDDKGAIWVGDGLTGVMRSTDQGATFENVAPDVSPSCLVASQGTIWACQPLGLSKPSLLRWDEAEQRFVDALALSKVDQMVDCSPEQDVPAVCAGAWVEWQRDVELLPGFGADAGVDAGSSADADAGAVGDAGDTPLPDAQLGADADNRDGASDLDAAAAPRRQSGGCAVRDAAPAQSRLVGVVLVALGGVLGRRRRSVDKPRR